MKVIKVVYERDGKLVSTFASGIWQKEYAEGVETKPDIGHLFAYSRKNLKRARSNFGSHLFVRYWLAEAEVVSRIKDGDITIQDSRWGNFWADFKLHLRMRKAEYLLCSSITLIKELT